MNNDYQNFVLNGLDGESKAAFLERIWNTTPDQMCLAQMIYDDAGIPVNYIILDINPAYEKAFGFARDKAINRKVTELFPHYDLAFIEKCGEAVRAGTSLISVTHISEPDLWYEVQVFPLGSGDQFITIAKDISERKKLENALSPCTEELENKEKEYLEIIDSFAEGTYINDLKKGEIYFSSQWKKRLGMEHLSPKQAAESFLSLIHPEDLDIAQRAYKEACSNQMPRVRMEIRVKTDQGYIWVLGQAKIFYDAEGRPVKYIGTHSDITERKRVEEEREWLFSDAEKQRSHLLSILMQLPVGVAVFDKGGKPLLKNELMDLYMPRMIPSKDPRGIKQWRALDTEGNEIPPDQWPGARALRGDTVVPGIEFTYTVKDGQERWITVSAAPLLSKDGEIIGGTSVANDITERKQAEEVLREKTKQLDCANRQKEDILESISDCFYVLDENLHFTYVNKHAEEIWGLSRTDLIGRKIEDIFPGIIDISMSKFHQVLHERTKQHYEVYSKVIDRWGDMGVYPMQDGVSVYFRDITERKRMAEALRESEEKYHNLFESMDEGYCIIEVLFDDNNSPLDYRFLEVNQAFERQTGLVDATGRYMREMAPDHEQHWFDIYGRIALTGEPVRFQNSADALGFFYDVYAFRIGQPQQRRVAILFNDITERKRMAEALRESELRQAFLLKLSDSLRPLSDASEIQRTAMSIVGEYLEVDRVMYNEITGDGKIIHIEDNYVRNGFKKVTGDFPVSSFGKAMDVLRRGEILIVEDQTTTPLKNPSEREASTSLQVYASATVPLIKNGRWVANFGVLHGTPRKWTEKEIAILQETAERIWAAVERAKAEEEILRARDLLEVRVEERTRELANERQRLFDILETLPVNISILTPDYHVPFANRAFRDMNGKPDERPCYEFIFGLNQPCESCQAFRPIETRQPHNWLFTAPDGRLFDVHDFLFTDGDGSSLILEMSLDITEQIRTETEMARLDRLNLIGEMAASIGHEIRNPMTAVRGFLQMLGDKKEYQYDREYFDIMIEEMDRANQIITQYLGMAKNKIVNLHLQSLDKGIKAIYPIIQSEGNLREMRIKLELCNPPEVMLDENEMRQLILNMCRNAMEAMLPHGTLTIGTRQEGNEVILYLKDEGSGLSSEIMDKMGTPFLTTKENGTGLGLAVCYSIAARHNAKIDYETGPSGTTFYVRFPINGEQSPTGMEKNGGGG